MSKASGTQLQDLKWDPHPLEKEISSTNQHSHLRKTQKENRMQQLSCITSQILNLRFNKIGSLFEEAGEYRVESPYHLRLYFRIGRLYAMRSNKVHSDTTMTITKRYFRVSSTCSRA